MRRLHLKSFILLVFLAMPTCITNAAGRRSFQIVPDSMLNSLGASAYAEATGQFPEITSGREYEMVQRLGRKLAAAVPRADGRADDYDWEFKLLDAPNTINAFALPGGKVAIYTGLLKITQNEDALAAVVGHEIAHVTLGHGNERMSQNGAAQVVLGLGDMALGEWLESPDTRGTVMQALAVGTQYAVLLPFSRTHESEADIHGLKYLVLSGYDPYEAPKLWQRMSAANPDRPPEWQSTHPDPDNRVQALQDAIPETLEWAKNR